MRAVLTAIECGYRSIDTAVAVRERGRGRRGARDLRGSPARICSSRPSCGTTTRGTTAPATRSRRACGGCGLDYVDLYLIHWPKPAQDRYVDTWRAFEKLYADGRVRAIGVSNFQLAHLQRLLDETDVVPAVNQVELHRDLQQAPLRRFHARHGIVTEAWSPLGEGRAFGHPVVVELARRHGRSPAQIVLRWHVQLGNVVIPKSTTPVSDQGEHRGVRFRAEPTPKWLRSRGSRPGTRLGPDPDERETRRRPGFSSAGGRWVSSQVTDVEHR